MAVITIYKRILIFYPNYNEKKKEVEIMIQSD